MSDVSRFTTSVLFILVFFFYFFYFSSTLNVQIHNKNNITKYNRGTRVRLKQRESKENRFLSDEQYYIQHCHMLQSHSSTLWGTLSCQPHRHLVDVRGITSIYSVLMFFPAKTPDYTKQLMGFVYVTHSIIVSLQLRTFEKEFTFILNICNRNFIA